MHLLHRHDKRTDKNFTTKSIKLKLKVEGKKKNRNTEQTEYLTEDDDL